MTEDLRNIKVVIHKYKGTDETKRMNYKCYGLLSNPTNKPNYVLCTR
jgi:hypothetical protein